MFFVKTHISASKVQGVGLFAGEDIQKGTRIWCMDDFSCKRMSPYEFVGLCKSMSRPSVLNIIHYTYKLNGEFVFLNDNLRFINHCPKKENVYLEDGKFETASRDIKKGEELFENYVSIYDLDDPFFLAVTFDKLSRDEIIAFLEIKYLKAPLYTVHSKIVPGKLDYLKKEIQ